MNKNVQFRYQIYNPNTTNTHLEQGQTEKNLELTQLRSHI